MSRRLLKRIIVFLAIGAAGNVVVAWVCSQLYLQSVDDRAMTPNACQVVWTRWAPIDYPGFDDECFGRSSIRFGMHIDAVGRNVQTTPGRLDRYFILQVTSGWPTRCLSGAVLLREAMGSQPRSQSIRFVNFVPWPFVAAGNPIMFAGHLPVRPIVLNGIVNSVVFAALFWFLWIMPSILRRQWRIRRRLCPGCAYPIGTSHVCTECGIPVDIGAGRMNPIENSPT